MIARLKWYYMNMGPARALQTFLMPFFLLGLAALNGNATYVLITLGLLFIGFFSSAPFGLTICNEWNRIQRWVSTLSFLIIGAVLLQVIKVLPASQVTFGVLVFALSLTHGINFWGASHPNMLTTRGVAELRKRASQPGSDARPLIFIETSKIAAQRPSTHSGPKLR